MSCGKQFYLGTFLFTVLVVCQIFGFFYINHTTSFFKDLSDFGWLGAFIIAVFFNGFLYFGFTGRDDPNNPNNW